MKSELDKKTIQFIIQTSNLLEIRDSDSENFTEEFQKYKEKNLVNWIPSFLTDDETDDLTRKSDLLFWTDLKNCFDETMKNRKLMAKAVKRAQLLTLQENRAKYLYKSDHDGFKSYHDFKKRQTLMAYNWANADDLHVVWKNLTTAEKGFFLHSNFKIRAIFFCTPTLSEKIRKSLLV